MSMHSVRPLGIVVPMEEEFRPYQLLLPDLKRVQGCGPWEVFEGFAGSQPLVLVISDCGPVNAAAALERLIVMFHPAIVLSGGSAGAHDPGIFPGDVVAGATYRILHPPGLQRQRQHQGRHPKGFRFRRDGRRHHTGSIEASRDLLVMARAVGEEEIEHFGPWTGPGWPPGTERRPGRVLTGVIGSTDSWTTSKTDLRALRSFYGSLCEDMESAYLAQLCSLHELPYLSVRTISDNEILSPLSPHDAPAAISLAGQRSARILTRIATAFGALPT